MSRIELAPELGEDFDRILDHLARHSVDDAPSRIREIIQAIDVLEHNRSSADLSTGTRESWSSGAAPGLLALYRYVAEIDTVFVLALRSQRERVPRT